MFWKSILTSRAAGGVRDKIFRTRLAWNITWKAFVRLGCQNNRDSHIILADEIPAHNKSYP
jgi:hypothetical protein